MPKKSKPLKRLPPNWGDRLTLEDIDETLTHWRDARQHYATQLAHPFAQEHEQDFARRQLAVVNMRVVLWEQCRAQHVAGRSMMPLLREAVK